MQDNLPELRDIHIPGGVSFFLPAYGWWIILLGIILGIVLLRLFLLWRRKSKKRFALKLLENIDGQNIVIAAAEMSEILRRICIYKYKNAAALMGKDWVLFLNSKCKYKLKGKPAELLINAPYLTQETKAYSIEEAKELREFSVKWIGENL